LEERKKNGGESFNTIKQAKNSQTKKRILSPLVVYGGISPL
jgi:hypothetical protein